MKVLGITGQVGAGKSTILAYLEEKYRAKVIQADQVGHLVMEPDTSCYKQICSESRSWRQIRKSTGKNWVRSCLQIRKSLPC